MPPEFCSNPVEFLAFFLIPLPSTPRLTLPNQLELRSGTHGIPCCKRRARCGAKYARVAAECKAKIKSGPDGWQR
jgi:hypothetical protein